MANPSGVCAIVPKHQEGYRPRVIGMGMVVEDRRVVTCAHVVDQAIGEGWFDQPGDGVVRVCFPYAQGSPCVLGIVDRNRYYRPGQAEEGRLTDIAVVELLEPAPKPAGRVVLRTHTDDAAVKVFGFRYKELPTGGWESHPDGEIVESKVLGILPGGRVYFEAIRPNGAAVEHGFSGAGVYDHRQGAVVGMVVVATAEAGKSNAQFIDVVSLQAALGYDSSTLGIDPFSAVAPPALRELYLPPDQVFERVNVDDFTGREWLEADLDAFLHDRDRGAWLLVGEAGVGKTAFLAHLVRKRGYPHFFAEVAPGDVNLPRAMQSLAVQLIARFELQPYAGRGELPPALSGSPDFLAGLLRAAAEKLKAGERLVLVLDALDEAGVFPGGNVLGLPRRLPARVYLVLSQRPRPVPLVLEPPPQRMDLGPERLQNRRDVRAFLERAAGVPEVAGRLRSQGCPVEQFVDVLGEMSRGNWMYLQYMVDEIRRGRRGPLALDTLPAGLVGYYAEHWGRWRSRPDWDSLCAPLLATLAAAFEPLTAERLALWAGVSSWGLEVLRRLLREEWRGFLYEHDGGYRLYHASLRDFFAGQPPGERFPPGVQAILDQMRDQTRKAHARVAMALREQHAECAALAADPYARRYLSSHLRRAGRRDELFALIDSPEWADAQAAADPSRAGYLNDLAEAWAAAEEVDTRAAAKGRKLPLLGREVTCAVATAGINNLYGNLPPELLAGLVTEGLWALPQALAAARRLRDPASQLTGLAMLALHYKVLQESESLRQILATMSELVETRGREWLWSQEDSYRWSFRRSSSRQSHPDSKRDRGGVPRRLIDLLRRLAEGLPSAERVSVLEMAWIVALTLPYRSAEKEKTLRSLLAQFPQERRQAQEEILWETLNYEFCNTPREATPNEGSLTRPAQSGDEWEGFPEEALLSALPGCPDQDLFPLWRAALNFPELIIDRRESLVILAEQLPRFHGADLSARLEDLCKAARRWRREDLDLPWAFAVIAFHVPSPHRERVAQMALRAARRQGLRDVLAQTLWKSMWEVLPRPDKEAQAHAFARLAPLLEGREKEEMLRAAIQAAHAPESYVVRAEVLAKTAQHLSASERRGLYLDALNAAPRHRDYDRQRVEALVALAAGLPDSERPEALAHALEEWVVTGWPASAGSDAISCVAPRLPRRLAQLALDICLFHSFSGFRTMRLLALAPALSEAERRVAARWAIEAMSTADLEGGVTFSDTELMTGEALSVWWARALADLIRRVPESTDRQRLFEEALEVTRRQADRSHQGAAALAELLRQAPLGCRASLLDEALCKVREIQAPRLRAGALLGLLQSSPGAPPALLEEAREAVLGARTGRQAADFASLVAYLPDCERSGQVDRILRAVESGWTSPYKVAALAELAEYLPPLDQSPWLRSLLRDGAWLDEHEHSVTISLRGFGTLLARLPLETGYPIWRELLHMLANHSYYSTFLGMRFMAAAVQAWGDGSLAKEAVAAIRSIAPDFASTQERRQDSRWLEVNRLGELIVADPADSRAYRDRARAFEKARDPAVLAQFYRNVAEVLDAGTKTHRLRTLANALPPPAIPHPLGVAYTMIFGYCVGLLIAGLVNITGYVLASTLCTFPLIIGVAGVSWEARRRSRTRRWRLLPRWKAAVLAASWVLFFSGCVLACRHLAVRGPDITLARAQYDQALHCSDREDYDGAIERTTEALRLEPGLSHAYTLRAQAYFHKREFSLAIADLDKFEDLGLANWVTYHDRGVAFLELGLLDSAIRDFGKSLRLHPASPITHYHRARAYETKPDLTLAFKDYDAAIALDPQYSQAYAGRARIHDRLGFRIKAESDRKAAQATLGPDQDAK